MNGVQSPTYRISLAGEKVKVHPSRVADVRDLDTNGDHYISDKELAEGYGLKEGHGESLKGQLHENKLYLAKQLNPDAAAYHSYAEVGQALKAMEKEHPELCQRVSLGKTAQGREIWALRMTEGADKEEAHQKPGIVITGCHHAREWMTVEVPLHSAEKLLEDYKTPEGKARLANSEVWIVPLVNPDGYEYSRNSNNMWRKNRQPIETTVDGEKVKAWGVDPNRNYDDGLRANRGLYRKDNDKPFVTKDDFEQGNDDPRSDVFRGLKGSSEKEVSALLKLELGHKNIVGVLDYHSYGETVMYPWGYTHRKPKGAKDLEAISENFNQAAGGDLLVQQSVGMYATLGSSNDIQFQHGIVGLTLEVNGCFQPHPSLIQPTCERYTSGNLAFIDDMIERSDAGTLPERSVPRRWREAAEMA